MDAEGGIKVFVRARPYLPREVEADGSRPKPLLDMTDCVTTYLDTSYRPKEKFHFDRCFWSAGAPGGKDQHEVYEHVARPMLDNIFQGYNSCLFAYGQTGSGKTFTMMGDVRDHALMGQIPRLCHELFRRIGDAAAASGGVKSFTVEASYMEIYNERVKDLLRPNSKDQDLRVRQHPEKGPFVDGITLRSIVTESEVFDLLKQGDVERTTAETKMNDRSSRSHAILVMTLTEFQALEEQNIQTKAKYSKISMIDLAGSERVMDSGVQGQRFLEATNINLSLTTLGRCINILADVSMMKKKGKKAPISVPPYRDSILTWVLSDSLGGNSITNMIATVSPSPNSIDETLSTLRYASRAKEIVNHAVVNEEVSVTQVKELQQMINDLKSQLSAPSKEESSKIRELQEVLRQKEEQMADILIRLRRNEEEATRASRVDVDSINSALSKEREDAKRLRAQLEARNKEYTQLEDRSRHQIVAFELRVEELKAERQRLMKQLEDEKKVSSKATEETRAGIVNASDVESKHAAIAKAAEAERLRKEVETKLSAERAKHVTDLKRVEQQLTAKAQRELAEKDAEVRALTRQVSGIESDKKRMEVKLMSQSEAFKKNMDVKNDDVTTLLRKLEKTRGDLMQLESVESDNQRLRGDLDDLQESTERLKANHRNEIMAMKTAIAQAETRGDDFATTIATLEGTVQALKEQISADDARAKEYLSALNAQTKENERVQKVLKETNDELEAMDEEAEMREKKLQDVVADMQQLRASTVPKTDYDTLQEAKRDVDGRLRLSEKESAMQQKQMEKLRNSKLELQTKATQAAAAADGFKRQVAEKTREFDALQQSSSSTIQRLEREGGQARDNAAAIRKELQMLQQHLLPSIMQWCASLPGACSAHARGVSSVVWVAWDSTANELMGIAQREYEEDVDALDKELAASQAIVAELEGKLQAVKDAAAADAEAAEVRHKKEIDELWEEFSKERESGEASHGRALQEVRADNAKLKGAVEKLQNEAASKAAELDSLRGELDHGAESRAKEEEGMRSALRARDAAIAELKEELSEAKGRLGELSAVESVHAAVVAERDRYHLELSEVAAQLATTKSEVDNEKAHAGSELAEAKNQREAAENRIELLREEVAVEKQRGDKLRAECEATAATLQELHTRFDAMSTDADSKEKLVARSQAELATRDVEIAKSNDAVRQLKDTVIALQEQQKVVAEDTGKQLRRLQSEKAGLESQVQHLEDTIARRKSVSTEATGHLRGELAAASDALNTVRAQYAALQMDSAAEISELRRDIEELSEAAWKLREAERRETALRGKLEEGDLKLEALRGEAGVERVRAERARDDTLKAYRELEEKQAELERLQDEVTSTTAALGSATERSEEERALLLRRVRASHIIELEVISELGQRQALERDAAEELAGVVTVACRSYRMASNMLLQRVAAANNTQREAILKTLILQEHQAARAIPASTPPPAAIATARTAEELTTTTLTTDTKTSLVILEADVESQVDHGTTARPDKLRHVDVSIAARKEEQPPSAPSISEASPPPSTPQPAASPVAGLSDSDVEQLVQQSTEAAVAAVTSAIEVEQSAREDRREVDTIIMTREIERAREAESRAKEALRNHETRYYDLLRESDGLHRLLAEREDEVHALQSSLADNTRNLAMMCHKYRQAKEVLEKRDVYQGFLFPTNPLD